MAEPVSLTAQASLAREVRPLVGSFWLGPFDGSELVEDILRSRAELELQTNGDLQEMANLTGRFGCPVFHRDRWMPLTIRQSEELTDDRLVYGNDDVLGVSVDSLLTTRTYDYSLPAGLQTAPLLFSSFRDPEVAWSSGSDYAVDLVDNRIRFREDPFLLSLPTELIYDNAGNLIDRILTLWFFQAEDNSKDYLTTQFGYVVGLDLTSSAGYLQLINALYDSMLLGTRQSDLLNALSAICDSPLVQTNDELVELIREEFDRKLVITDRRIYVCGANSNITVSVGNSLLAGDVLNDAFRIFNFSQGTPLASELASLTIPAAYFQFSLLGTSLIAENTLVPVVVTVDSGRTRVDFDLTGNAADVAMFFDIVHTRGIAPGNQTLAQLLDTRAPENQIGDPTAAELPSQVNPLEFFVDNVLGYGALLIQLRPESFGSNALGMSLLDTTLRKIVPPQQTAFVEII